MTQIAILAQSIRHNMREKMVGLGYQDIERKLPTLNAIEMVLETINASPELMASWLSQSQALSA